MNEPYGGLVGLWKWSQPMNVYPTHTIYTPPIIIQPKERSKSRNRSPGRGSVVLRLVVVIPLYIGYDMSMFM